ncbi:hypothetical protein BGZ95_003301, partial [Linnemannia exigua]
MPDLRRLSIHIPSLETRIPIEDMFPLFSRLEELDFAGSWHKHEIMDEQTSSNNNMSTPWRLKKLKCNRPDQTLTRFCLNLTHFEMLSLETVKLPSGTSPDDFVDVAETLRSLEALRSLTFDIRWRREVEFL